MDALQTLEVPITSETNEEEITVTSPLSVARAEEAERLREWARGLAAHPS